MSAACAAIAFGPTATATGVEQVEPARPPKAFTGGAIAVREFHQGVSIFGVIATHGISTHYRFEFGQTKRYGGHGGGGFVRGGDEPTEVAGLTGRLAAFTTYHYRLIAWSTAGRSEGRDRTFRTPCAVAADASTC
jgi:hypothetical protein